MLAMNFVVSKPWNFFIQNSTCLLTLQLPLFTLFMWLQSQNKRTCQHHTNKQLKRNNQNIYKQNEKKTQKMFKKQVVAKKQW
jgi:hypothetical protein